MSTLPVPLPCPSPSAGHRPQPEVKLLELVKHRLADQLTGKNKTSSSEKYRNSIDGRNFRNFTKGWWSSDQRVFHSWQLLQLLSHTIPSRKHNSTIPVSSRSSLPFLELKLQSAQPGSDIAQRVPYVMPDTFKVGQNIIATPKLITSPGHSEEVLPCWSRSSWATARLEDCWVSRLVV